MPNRAVIRVQTTLALGRVLLSDSVRNISFVNVMTLTSSKSTCVFFYLDCALELVLQDWRFALHSGARSSVFSDLGCDVEQMFIYMIYICVYWPTNGAANA